MDRHAAATAGLTQQSSDLALVERLFDQLRNRILDGVWRHGEKIPGSRNIAKEAGVSRWAAVTAVEMLLAEGLVQTRERSGTYVAWEGNGADFRPNATASSRSNTADPLLPFAVGDPGLDLFPMETWRRLQARCWRVMPVEALRAGSDGGWPDLRAAIAAHVSATRAIKCKPSQVFISTSAHAAVHLAGEILCRPGTVAWVEEPGYFRTRAALQAAGLFPVGVAVDEQGLDISDGLRLAPKASMAVTTPSIQFPTGAILSETRKKALLDWSARVGSFILEDDYTCEFSGAGMSSPPLAAMPNAQRVVYMNTFSTTIFPSLRLSYLIVPLAIADRFAEALRRTERYATIPNQIVLAEFISSGEFAKHLSVCREAYAERRDALVAALRDECADVFAADPVAGGMHLCAMFKRPTDDIAAGAAAAEAGLIVEPLSRFYGSTPGASGLLLGFAGHPAHILRESARLLARTLAAQAGDRNGIPA